MSPLLLSPLLLSPLLLSPAAICCNDHYHHIVNLLRQVRAGLPQVLQGLPQHPNFARLDAEQRAALERAVSS